MPSLITQQDFRIVQTLPFCYLCGEHFKLSDDINRDHLPPSALFEKEDRDVPLILPTHVDCNAEEHVSDEFIGLFVSTIHGRRPKQGHSRLNATAGQFEGRSVTFCKDMNIHHFILRCVRGFHAALYHGWLPEDTINSFHPPLRGGLIDGITGKPADAVQAMLLLDKGVQQHALFSKVVKENRIASNSDKVVSRNGKCTYECVWSNWDDGGPMCIFGLKIYEWQQFELRFGNEPRGCTGFYSPAAGQPKNATRATDLVFPFENIDSLDPFGK